MSLNLSSILDHFYRIIRDCIRREAVFPESVVLHHARSTETSPVGRAALRKKTLHVKKTIHVSLAWIVENSLPLPQLLPLLLESLAAEDAGLKQSTLDGLYSLVQDTPSAVCDHVPTILPRLLSLARAPDSMVSM